MKRLRIDYFDLSAAFQMDPMMETTSYFDRETGQVVMIPDEAGGVLDEIRESVGEDATDAEIDKAISELDHDEYTVEEIRFACLIEREPDRFAAIFRRDSHESWRVMRDFVATVNDRSLRERLEVAIQGRGAFRMFRNEIAADARVQARWRTFEQTEEIRELEEWLEDRGIEPDWVHLPKLEAEVVAEEADVEEDGDLDVEKMVEVTLALLLLNTWTEDGETRAWKTHSWDLMDRLHARGWISNPKGKTKSVILTEEGERMAESMLEKHFGK